MRLDEAEHADDDTTVGAVDLEGLSWVSGAEGGVAQGRDPRHGRVPSVGVATLRGSGEVFTYRRAALVRFDAAERAAFRSDGLRDVVFGW